MDPGKVKRIISTIRWHEKWDTFGDHDRSVFRAKAARRLIAFWEKVRRCKQWTPISIFYKRSQEAERRWVRRTCYTLEAAGLIDIRRPPQLSTARLSMEIRVKKGF